MPWEIRLVRSRVAHGFMGRLHQAQTTRMVKVERDAGEPAVETESVDFTSSKKHADR